MNKPTKAKKTSADTAISRRDFLKIGATAAAGAASAVAVPRIGVPTFIRQSKMELNLLTWFWTEPGRGDAWRAMIQKFHESQSDIQVNESGYGENDYFQQILIQARSGRIDGDMFTQTPDGFLRLMNAGHTISLEDVVKKAGVTLSKAQDMLRKDGEVHGLDIVTVRFGLVYNKALFDAAGIGEPTDIDSWVAGATALTERPNQFGIYSPHLASEPFTVWFTLAQWPVLFGGVLAEGQKPMLDSEPVINGIKLFKQMYDAAMPQGTDLGTANQMFANSKIAQYLIVSAAVNQWKTNAEDPELYGNLRSAAPFWPSKKGITRIHPICINANTDPEKQEAAKVFLSWLYEKENYQELLERCLDVIPAIDGGIRPEYRETLTWADGYDATEAITVPEVLGDFVLFNDELGQVVTPYIEEILVGATSVEDGMGAAQADAVALAERVFTS
ncbi:MAG: extracellular solute-binding protein [Anaerolineae bacterium]|nr:extracellular solute-binding protein [Anaerolineae bacterium]